MATSHREISLVVESQLSRLAESMVTRQFAAHPELAERYGASGRGKCLEDARYHLTYLAQAIWLSSPLVFADYVAWADDMLEARGIAREDLVIHLRSMVESAQQMLAAEAANAVRDYVEGALAQLPETARTPSPAIVDGDPLAGLAKVYLRLLLNGDRRGASRLILERVEAGTGVKEIYLYVFQPCQYEIGRLWQLNKISVAQEHFCTAATQLIMAQLYPKIFSGTKTDHRFIGASVAGELHELGPRMVCDFLELAGWDTYYLGANNPTEGLIKMILEFRPHVIGVSASLSFHVREVERFIGAVRSSEHGKIVKILVGGAAFNRQENLWRQIGADGKARNAAESVVIAKNLISH